MMLPHWVVEAIRLSGIKQYSGSTLPPTYPNKAFVGHIAEKHNLSYDQNVGGNKSVTLAGRTYKSARKALNAALAIIEEDQAQGTAPNVAPPQENEATEAGEAAPVKKKAPKESKPVEATPVVPRQTTDGETVFINAADEANLDRNVLVLYDKNGNLTG
jgi:hypothetical protein